MLMKQFIVYVGKSLIPLLGIVAIVALIAVSLVLFAMSYYLLRRRARKKLNSLLDENGKIYICNS
jgi:lipopolysaccharide export LptBFGC system permease protein LptF